jgi:demethylmenaquinone methyltransferase/2-methoxy-6-polyprenyl-1,4-benzoquinol methylase
MALVVLDNLTQQPSTQRAVDNYRVLAANYDATCTRVEALRIEVINMLKLQAGETVLDIACGTGSTLPLLAAAVGSAGRVVGVELSVEMAAQAAKRVAHLPQASIVQTSMINYSPIYKADALLMCYAQDVLQCSKTVDQLIAASKPGARIALVGMQTLPWLWGWPVNLFNLYRARRYLTTYANMDKPWRLLEERGAQLRLVRTALWGSAYLVVGNLPN